MSIIELFIKACLAGMGVLALMYVALHFLTKWGVCK